MTADHGVLPNWLGALAMGVVDAQRSAVAVAGPESTVATLLTLREFPGTGVGELAGILGLTHSAAVRVCDGLVADGLARRNRHDADARRVSLTLTAAGRRDANRMQAARLRALDALLEPLSTRQRHQFATLLDTMLRGRERDRATARRTCRFCAHRSCTGPACPVGSSVPVADTRQEAQR